MPEPVRITPTRSMRDPEADPHMHQEWLVTNGLGGYASGTVSGTLTRRYHGLLIAALPNPGRMVMLDAFTERLRRPDRHVVYAGPEELTGSPAEAVLPVSEFHLELGLPIWRYESDGFVLEKRLLMPYRQNTVHVSYRLVEGHGPVRLGIRPELHFRPHDAPLSAGHEQKYTLTVEEDRFEITTEGDQPTLRLILFGKAPAFTFDRKWNRTVLYQTEANRGYDSHGCLWSPGYFRVDLAPGEQITLVASTENWDAVRALEPEQAFDAELERRRLLLSAASAVAHDPAASELVLAADQFLIIPTGRPEQAARARPETKSAP